MNNEEISESLKNALNEGFLLKTSLTNIQDFLNCESIPNWILSSIRELAEQGDWNELNNRFYKNLTFGTGGMRGRTIGEQITPTEKGNARKGSTPEYAAVGSNTLNEITVLRATKALYLHTLKWLADDGIFAQPRIVIAHDVRHFSEKFCKLAANAWEQLGGFAMIFEGPRSTPQLSFTVRHQYAHAGVVITASHNPFHDNGFKAYFVDGAQLVSPHAEEVVKRYEKIGIKELLPLLDLDEQKISYKVLTTEHDLAYRAALEDAVFDPEVLKNNKLKIVFTPIHGTGSISSIPALWDHGVEVAIVDEQNKQDPNFNTVDSPNPENPEALKLAISVAQKTKSDLVLGSDPDCDRIGVAVRSEGKFKTLSGNQVASMLAEYRLTVAKRKNIISDEGSQNVALLKTFVTTPLIQKIAESYNIKCINTQTGFKWMAKKLAKYENQATVEIKEKEGLSIDYDDTELFARIDILTRYSTYVILSAEESYGYLPLDIVRDKDGNASALAIAELFAFLKSIQTDPMSYLDNLYKKYGYHEERTENLYFEGAEGNQTIKNLAQSYRSSPLKELTGIEVIKTKDFLESGYIDEDEDELPQENFLILELANNFSVAIRPSGTEPKIKYYIFGSGEKMPTDLNQSKDEIGQKVSEIAKWLVEDANKRIENF